jgi:hypothetical protein
MSDPWPSLVLYPGEMVDRYGGRRRAARTKAGGAHIFRFGLSAIGKVIFQAELLATIATCPSSLGLAARARSILGVGLVIERDDVALLLEAGAFAEEGRG